MKIEFVNSTTNDGQRLVRYVVRQPDRVIGITLSRCLCNCGCRRQKWVVMIISPEDFEPDEGFLNATFQQLLPHVVCWIRQKIAVEGLAPNQRATGIIEARPVQDVYAFN